MKLIYSLRVVGLVLMCPLFLSTMVFGDQGSKSPTPKVSTGEGTPLGLHAMTVNGRIHPDGAPTLYWFDYGTDASCSQRTGAKRLPPQLTAHFHEDWDAGHTAGWRVLAASEYELR